MAEPSTIAQYLLRRLADAGIEHVFRVPGDYILRFYEELTKSSLQHIGTTREDTAAFAPESTRERVENADLLLMLGVALNDVDTGVYTARLDPNRIIRASQNEVMVRYHRYSPVTLQDYLQALIKGARVPESPWPEPSPGPQAEGFPHAGRPMSTSRLIGRLNAALTPDITVVADTGDCLFSALELRVHARTQFLASAFYTTMGFGVPAALGAQIARPDRRPLILVGDGAFQMTGTELVTSARLGLDPIVVVFNNRGYSTERFILDGPFNDIGEWRFDKLGEVFGPLKGFNVDTENQFEKAWQAAFDAVTMPSLINVHLQPDDASPAMRRLTEHLRAQVSGL